MRFAAAQQGARQGNLARIAFARQPFNRRAARKAQAQNLGGLVKGLTQGVVNRGAQTLVASRTFHQQDLAMPARNQQQQIGELQRAIGQTRGQSVAFQMVDRDQRLARCHSQRLGTDQPDHDPADQAGASGGRNRIDIGKRHARIGQSCLNQRRHSLRMGARGDFRDDSAIGPVRIVLRGDTLRDDAPFAVHQRGCRFITG